MFIATRTTLICLISCICIVVAGAELPLVQSTQERGTVYVLLDKQTTTDGHLWTISSSQGCEVYDLFNRRRSDTLQRTEISFDAHGCLLHIDGRKVPRHIIIKPLTGELSVGKRSYAGSLIVMYKEGTWYLVNGVDLEDYVCSVLGSESWPGWPLDVNKALAIVLRSYVIAKRIEARTKRKLGQDFLYDVLNTNMHQTYHGSHTHQLLRQAVEETKGMILTHQQKPILAMYDACCGGIIPAHIEGVNFIQAPYLARSYACTFCAHSCSYKWNAHYTHSQIVEHIKQNYQQIKSIQRMYVSKVDKAGIVKKITLHCNNSKKRIEISGKKCYSLFKDIKSYAFSIKKHANGYTFEGTGYGHHIGLCQWGVRKMIELGWSWTDILKFYYPEVELMLIAWK